MKLAKIKHNYSSPLKLFLIFFLFDQRFSHIRAQKLCFSKCKN